jgi:DNA repair protein RadC
MKIHGIKSGKATQIVACFELARRLESFGVSTKFKINSPEDVYRRLYPAMRESKKEHFIELCLDTKNQVIREDTVSIGSLNANVVHPREVFRTALMESAAHTIVAHNHPSGDPTPSREDIDITKKLVETGKIMGIDVLDHIIIGDGRHFSMKEAEHLEIDKIYRCPAFYDKPCFQKFIFINHFQQISKPENLFQNIFLEICLFRKAFKIFPVRLKQFSSSLLCFQAR